MEAFFAGLGFTVAESILAVIACAMTYTAWHVGRIVTKIEAHAQLDELRFTHIDEDLGDGKESFKEIRNSLSKLHDRINNECRDKKG